MKHKKLKLIPKAVSLIFLIIVFAFSSRGQSADNINGGTFTNDISDEIISPQASTQSHSRSNASRENTLINFDNIVNAPCEFDEAHYREQWALVLNNDGRRVLAKIAGYMKERQRRGKQWLGPLHRTRLPLKLIWGRRDPIAVYAIAEKICTQNPRASLLTLDDVAHYPQLEIPQQVANGVLKATLNSEIT